MKEITKNRQSEETLREMAKATFPEKEVSQIVELTDGTCNIAYRICFMDGMQTIVKIAPPEGIRRMANEVNMMEAEVRGIRLASEQTDVPVPKIYTYDKSRSICDSDFFFMEMMRGKTLLSLGLKLPPWKRGAIHRQIGKIERSISTVKGDYFGFLGEDKAYHSLYEFVRQMIENVILDAAAANVDLPVNGTEILDRLKLDQAFFDEVTQPVLIHWDLWEGNIFVEDSKVTGIIDWERAMWAEPFLDDRFRSHSCKKAFLSGYGQTKFRIEEQQRILWYDVLMYLTMITEDAYRQYPTDQSKRFGKMMFKKSWKKLRG